jgi:hypothetical protein
MARQTNAFPLLALLVTLAASSPADAQVLYGSLTGSVVDSTGGVLPGVQVVALNTATGVSKEDATDERGAYLFRDLQPGTYRVTLSLSGFRRVVQDAVVVEANFVRRLDTRLEPSAISEAVVVTARTAILQTDQGSIHATQSAEQINQLPLTGTAGRNYQSLMTIVPGALMAGEQNSAAGSPQRSLSFNVNGVSRMQNNTKLDGASIVYPWLPTNTAYVPSAEAIEEVSIVTNSYNAEQGLAGGAAINVVMKSGGNALRGTGWFYDTNAQLKARNYFQTTTTNPADDLKQYGGNLGGPLAKNRLFFFTNWERSKRVNSSPVRFYSLATDALRRGDFSGTGVVIYDPASNADPSLRTPFPGNIIPANRIDLAASELIRRMPSATLLTAGFANNYTASGDGTFQRDNIDVKINYNSGRRLQFFGRYSNSPSQIFDPPSLGDAGGDALNGGQVGNAPGRTHVAGAGATYTLGSNILIDASFGYTRQKLGAENVDIDSNFGLDVLKIPGTNGSDRLQGGIPSFQVNGWANLGNPNTGNPFQFNDSQYVGSLNVSWIRSAHAIRFGYDYQNQQLNHFQPQGGTFQTTRGTFQFNGNSTRLQNGPTPSNLQFNSWADFLLGLPSGAGKVVQLRNPNSVYMTAHSLYAQDTWQLSRVTLNYGLRWELYPFATRGATGVSRFDPSDGNVYTGGLSGVPLDTGAKVGPGSFLPRVGIAYRLNEKTVVRAGYGHSADPKPYIDFRNAYPINFAWSHPAVTSGGVTNAFIPVTTLRLGLNEALFGAGPDLTQGVIRLPAGAGTTTFPKEDSRKYIQSYNVAVQRELRDGYSVQVGYVGTRALGQQAFVNINASAPGTGNAGRPLSVFGIVNDITMVMPYRDTVYNALQTEFKGRMRASLFGVVYTLSRATNYADNDANPRIQWLDAAELNKGPAGYDRTHNLQGYWVWDLPFGSGRTFASEGIRSKLFGGWQVNGILSRMSGTPIGIIQGNAGNLNAGGSSQYPDQVASSVTILNGVGSGNPYFDPVAYAPVSIAAGQPQRFGNSGRNPIRGPGFFNIDLGIFRTVPLARSSLQFRIELLNVLDHPNFANPGSDVSTASTFGIISSTLGGTTERQLRLGVRYAF